MPCIAKASETKEQLGGKNKLRISFDDNCGAESFRWFGIFLPHF